MDGYGTQENISSLSKDISDTAIRGNSIYSLINLDSPRSSRPDEVKPSWWSWDDASKKAFRAELKSETSKIGGDFATVENLE